MINDYGTLAIYALIVLGVVTLLVVLSSLLGPSKPYRAKLQPYESGIVPTQAARHRMSVRFYLTAMLFIIFDVEAVFFYPWAVMLHQLGWYGVIEMAVFMVILVIALAHIWKKGGLDWE